MYAFDFSEVKVSYFSSFMILNVYIDITAHTFSEQEMRITSRNYPRKFMQLEFETLRIV